MIANCPLTDARLGDIELRADFVLAGVTETGYSDHVDEETEPTLKTYKGFGKCSCNDGHEGTACEHKKCPTFQTHVCAEHGHCDQDTGRCHCETDYFGYDCSAGNGMNTDLGVEL